MYLSREFVQRKCFVIGLGRIGRLASSRYWSEEEGVCSAGGHGASTY